MSILSFPERGHWGKASWRGNCSGHVYKELFERIRPNIFVDPMVGSGTSVDVAKEMGIEAYGLDLHSGFNAIRDSILAAVGKPADLVVSHPPYGAMILYSGAVWGKQPHPDDLSRCSDDEEFHEKMQLVLLNQREATKPGGFYGTTCECHSIDTQPYRVMVWTFRLNGVNFDTHNRAFGKVPSKAAGPRRGAAARGRTSGKPMRRAGSAIHV